MGTRIEQKRSLPGGGWVLPLLLALIILLVVLGALFGSKIKDAISGSATATPTAAAQNGGASKTVVVVTATPGGSNGGSPATATTGGGASTPLPHATSVPTVPGLRLGMITRPQATVTTIQSGVDSHNSQYSYYLNPIQVVQKSLPQYGFTQGFTIVSPNPSGPTPTPFTGADNRPIVKVEVQYQGKIYTVSLAQAGKQGPGGIWIIVTILQGRQ